MAEATVPLRSHEEAILVLGPYDRYARLLRQDLDIEIFARAGNLRLKGPDDGVTEAVRRVEHLLGKVRKGRELGVREIESILLDRPIGEPERRNTSPSSSGGPYGMGASGGTPFSGGQGSGAQGGSGFGAGVVGGGGARSAPVRFRPRPIQPRNENQRRYLETIERCPLTFGLGVAGTGKTYLAVSAAIQALRRGEVRRLIISRPVVEAGEHLGFLPGDLQQKLNPYMRPIYDALRDMVEVEDLARLEEAGVIEIAPLAYMRGRTLSNAFVILDEAQNTTIGQMKMFLTRMGEGSFMVVTGDPSQNDLPRGVRSGLMDAVHRLRGFDGIGIAEFEPGDVVRHPLVARIVRAYLAPSPVPEDEPLTDGGADERRPERRPDDRRRGR
ncbi:MAG: PhoH family protein [Planctomycetota bacterium]